MPEPEAELQATANLSPVSPSPVHASAPQLVPALQDTVDTIDAMVAAAAAPNGIANDANPVDPMLTATNDNDDVVDDDSFNDAYGEEEPEAAVRPAQEQQDSNDDYAKMFDSPIGPEEGEGHAQPQDVSSMPRESNGVTLPPGHLISRSPDAPVAVPDSSSTYQAGADPSAVHPGPGSEPAMTGMSQIAAPEQASHQPTPSQPTGAAQDQSFVESSDPSADIQRLVADLTAQPADPNSSLDPSVSAKAESPADIGSLPTSALPSSASLPPRPPLPHSASQSYASQHHPSGSNSSISVNAIAPPTPGQPSTYVVAGAPGTSTDVLSSLPPPPATGLSAPVAIASLNAPPHPSHTPSQSSTDRGQDGDYQHEWEQFMSDERQYMSEAKWDRFPEGSRIFIGNLSSDKVSKRDVFDLFHKYGRLAQISLKSAYGFVQYHAASEGHAAMENLQGIEIKGRRIHLEISRAQDKSKKDRNRSPDRRGRDGREGRDGGRRGERHNQHGRDDYHPGRNNSPRRNDYGRDEGFGRDRGFSDSRQGRGRSRSPVYGRNGKDSYRKRSPSPYGRSRPDDIDLPRRYGADVPDVQIILQPDVNRDFVGWVENTFKAKGLKTEVMYLHPRIPKDQVIQRQAADGVHAVVDLDLRAQNLGRIPVQAFDRSGGISNVRFDQYVDLDPNTAAEVILRAKASGASAYGQTYAPPTYGNQYGGQSQQPAPGAHYPGGQHQPQPGPYPPQQAPSSAADIASLMGQVDNATLQRLLASIQTTPQQAGLQRPGTNSMAASANTQVDIQAILGSLNGNAAAQHQAPPPAQYGGPYGGQAAPNGGAAQPGGGDAAAQVQNIMAQLARYRQ